MKLSKILILALMSWILLFAIPLSFILHSVHQTVLKPYSWDTYIEDVEVHEQFKLYVREQFNEFQHPLKTQFEETFNTVLERALDQVMTSSWTQSKLNDIQHNVWDYLLYETDTIEPLELESLLDVFIERFIQRISEAGVPAVLIEAVTSEMKTYLPSEIRIEHILPVQQEQLVHARAIYRQTQVGYEVIILVSSLLLISGLLLIFYPKGLLLWSGLVVGGISLITFIFAWLLQSLAPGEYIHFAVTPGFGHALTNIMSIVIRDMLGEIIQYTLFFSALGLVLVGISLLPGMNAIDQKLKSIFSQNAAFIWLRGIVIAMLLATSGWQIYKFALQTEALL